MEVTMCNGPNNNGCKLLNILSKKVMSQDLPKIINKNCMIHPSLIKGDK